MKQNEQLSGFIIHTLIERLKQLQVISVDTWGRCVPVCYLLGLISQVCWMGIFHALGWMNAMLHDFNFFLLPRSLGCHPACVCVSVCDFLYVFISVYMCVDWSAFEYESVCVCVYMSWEIYSSEHAGFRGICGSGHKAWIAQWLRSGPPSEVAPY